MTVTTPSVDETAIDELKAEVRGPVLQSEDDDYDEARTVYNAMIDRLPGIIVRPIGAADITTTVNFAREQDLLVAVKGGRNNVAGLAVCDDGLMIVLGLISSVQVDPDARTTRVEPRRFVD